VGVTMGYLHYVNCVCACVGGDVNDREEEGRIDNISSRNTTRIAKSPQHNGAILV